MKTHTFVGGVQHSRWNGVM